MSSIHALRCLALASCLLAPAGMIGADPDAAAAPSAGSRAPAKLQPPSSLKETAPETFRVRFTTSKGDFVVQVNRAWAPRGADRFYNLVKSGFYDGQRFFRVMRGFVVQWGIHGDPAVSPAWRIARIADDPVKESNRLGTLSFAKAGPHQRTTQVFINLAHNKELDAMGFAPFGLVVEGMDVVKKLYAGYGDSPPRERGPVQARIEKEGNAYLAAEFPKLDSIVKATLQ